MFVHSLSVHLVLLKSVRNRPLSVLFDFSLDIKISLSFGWICNRYWGSFTRVIKLRPVHIINLPRVKSTSIGSGRGWGFVAIGRGGGYGWCDGGCAIVACRNCCPKLFGAGRYCGCPKLALNTPAGMGLGGSIGQVW